MFRRRTAAFAVLALGAGVMASATARSDARAPDGRAPNSGIFRVVFAPPEQLDTMDPAKANTQAAWSLLDLTCARLMAYPHKRPPAAFVPVPEVAARPPTISRDGKTYTFILRRGLKFSNGEPVDARAFETAINRTLSPVVRSLGAKYMEDIVGARDVQSGRARTASGVRANGYRLTIRLTQPLGDFAERTTMPFFCAVPPGLPPDAEGRAQFPGSGPYYVSMYRPGQRIEIRRNRYYGGKQVSHVTGFSVDLTSGSPDEILNRIEGGRADWGIVPPPMYFEGARSLVRKYGLNRKGGQFQSRPGFTLRAFVMNTSRGIFRDNLSLRRAVNYAIDRTAYGTGNLGSRYTDQLLPPSLPGFVDAKRYPLRGNLAKAKGLARGHLRGGKAVLYVVDLPLTRQLGQILKRQLARIELDVEVRPIPGPAYYARLSTPGEPFDLAFHVTPNVDYYDPYAFLNIAYESRFIGHTNYSHFRSATWDRRLRAASRLHGKARERAYGLLDVQLARDVAGIAPLAYISEPTLVSKRVGCLLVRPAIDLATVCIKG